MPGLEEHSKIAITGAFIPDSYKNRIVKYLRIGKYIDDDGKQIDVLAVHLKRETSLERARTAQRNFIAWYLNGGRGDILRDAALVAFYTDDLDDWRFSLVRMEYRTEQTPEGKVKVKSEFTPARRYSFLVGKNEPNHTAQQQFAPLLENDKKRVSLADLEHAFNIESITKEFFEDYKALFLKIKEELVEIVKADSRVREDFADKQIETVNFAKKLLGQIVFLYFLQKKGWLGVGKDDSGKFENWGTGPKNFLRRLFDKEIVEYKNFFNDILEPLFYEALATPRENDYYSRFDRKIPFLNGGLFEPICGYNWQEQDILLKNETLKEVFDTFDLYNFTVREDEPLEKEVAVDPEMLGKVFENLLEVIDRKSKGAFYTPREIVHFMCQESLVSYLDKTHNTRQKGKEAEQTGLSGKLEQPTIPRKDIEAFVRYGALLVENDKRVMESGKETKTYSFQMPESIRVNAELIDDALLTVKVCDLAIGSGAFAVGFMHEIVKARDVLTTYISNKKNRTRYDFKRHAIQESIYGVDIDPGAVEIAKLRLWLSLVVDEDDYHTIKPLPNLDYKIMQGNSLFEEYEGIKLFDDRLIKSGYSERTEQIKSVKEQRSRLEQEYIARRTAGKLTPLEDAKLKDDVKRLTDLFNKLRLEDEQEAGTIDAFAVAGNAYKIAKELRQLHTKIFEVSDKATKDALRKEIEELEWRLIEETLKEEGKADLLPALERYKKSSNKPFFIWKLHFAEVFQEKGGFDIVIANPPYVRQETIKPIKDQLAKEFGAFYCGTADLYTYFYKRGIDLLKPVGHLCFIAPNKFMRAGYGKNTRVLLASQATPQVIIDFGDLPIFDATTYPSILLIEKRRPAPEDTTIAATFTEESQIARPEATLASISFTMPVTALKPVGWNLEQPEVCTLTEKLRSAGKPLGEFVHGRFYRGILTGFNEAFVIDEATRKKLIAEDSKSKEVIKPWLRGRDIKKWKAEWAKLYVIFTRRGIDISRYPAIKRYLEPFKADLRPKTSASQKRGRKPGAYKWYEIQDSIDYHGEFEKPKIVMCRFMKSPLFCYEEGGMLFNDANYFLNVGDKYVLAFFMSRVGWTLLTKLGTDLSGGFYQLFINMMESVPVFPATDKQKAPIISRVEKILADPAGSAVPRLEREIDELVYKLYNLTQKEIAIIEKKK